MEESVYSRLDYITSLPYRPYVSCVYIIRQQECRRLLDAISQFLNHLREICIIWIIYLIARGLSFGGARVVT